MQYLTILCIICYTWHVQYLTCAIPDKCKTWHVQYLTSGVGSPSAIRWANGINIPPSWAVKPWKEMSNLKRKCFDQLASLLGFLILFNPFFLGYLLVPASAVEKASGTITGDSWAKSGDLFLHSWFVLYTTRDVRPRSVVLITMLGLILWPFLVGAVHCTVARLCQSFVILGGACGLRIWLEFVRLWS